MAVDAATRDSLEILSSQQGGRVGSLVHAIDRTVTGAGARLLASDLGAPLTDLSAIRDRLALVQWFHADPLLRESVREALKAIPDLARALGRVVAGRGSPRDLGQLRDGLSAARTLRERLGKAADLPDLMQRLLPDMQGHGALVEHLTRALVESPPTERQQGGYIARGYDAALDALRDTSGNARRAIAALEADYKAQTGVQALKIRHNAVLGYFIEVPAARADALMKADSGFAHRQTMAGAVRFNSPALHEEAMRIAQAGTHAQAAEEAHFEGLCEEVIAARDGIARTAAAIARIDVACGHAQMAAEGDYCCPELTEAPEIAIEGGRHPVVEAALRKAGQAFVANDANLSERDRLWLVSGPNMGGKSTFLRQTALIVLLADLAQYAVHRAFHAVPLLWRFHRVHHSVEQMDWLAGSRLHLVDVIVTRGLVLLPIVMLGFDPIATYAYLGFVSLHAVFIHANFAPKTAWLERWIAMPRYHHWHHAIEPEATDKNFAVHLPMIDRWFGTYYMPHQQWPSGYGVSGLHLPDGYVRQFVSAFVPTKRHRSG